MLGIEDFAKQVQDRLNTIASGYEGAIPFKIYTNLGDYVQAYRVINEIEQYQFGIMRVLPSEIVPVKGLSVQNLVIQVEFGVEIDKSELDDNGNYLQVVYTQQILNNYAQSTTGTTETIEGLDGKNYTVAYSINPCTVGSVTMTSSDKGEVLPVQITIDVSAVENGVNLNDIDVFIDGEAVYPLNIQATRKRIPNENSFSDKTSTSVGILQNGFGLDMIVPALYNELGETILDDIYDGKDNVARCVNFKFNKWITYYTYTISGLTKVNYERHSVLYSYNRETGYLNFNVVIGTNKSIQIFSKTKSIGNIIGFSEIDYGDGTKETSSITGIHTYTNAGTYTIKIKAISTKNIFDEIEPKDRCYIMTFGNTSHNTSANNTITPSISLVEGVPHIMEYDEHWTETTVTYTQTTTKSFFELFGSQITSVAEGDIIFINGKLCLIAQQGGISIQWHTFEAGTYTLRKYRP